MAPNASPIFNFNMSNHAGFIQKNLCHQFKYNNDVGTILFKNRMKLIRENFTAINSYYLKENIIEPVSNFSASSVVSSEKNELTWLDDVRSVTHKRLELIRQTMVQQTVKEKMEIWQKKKDEMFQIRKFDVSIKPKIQRDEILVKKENYRCILDQIKKHSNTNTEQTTVCNYQQRTREICFKVALKKSALIVTNINNSFNNQQLLLNIGYQIDVYNSMVSRLDVLKNILVVEEASLIAAQELLEELTSYKTNLVIQIQEEIKTSEVKTKPKKNFLNIFSVNIPNDNVVKHVRRQYVALAKNNKALIKKLTYVHKLPFINDPTTKLFRQNLTKVINTLVNTISSTNKKLLIEKYNKLNALLSGKLINVANTQIMIGDNEEALAFCMDTLAAKVISYAEEVISVKTQAAYEIALVIAKLWNVHQQFGKILFAAIKEKCPLLAPYCYPIARGLSDEILDHKSFGYKTDSTGNVECHDKYLKRMTGIVRLYAALIVTTFKYNQPVIGLSQAWIFVAGTLNQNPVADITATLLVEFLNIVGFAMHQTYGKQFFKLLQYIDSHYLKKIILVTPEGYGGPITRLNSFISKSLSSGFIMEPTGMLSTDFW